jgi:transcriptional regulator with XRE-family HTH domain
VIRYNQRKGGVQDLNERIAIIRKEKKLSQEKFAEELNLSRNFINQVESGKKMPSERTIKDICLKFGVNEEWLRTGEGEMLLPMDRETELAKLTVDLFMEESDSFKSRFISMLARMSDEEWSMLENMVEKLSKKE